MEPLKSASVQKKRPVWAVLYFYQVYNAEKFLVKKKETKKKKKNKKKRERANHMSVQNKEHTGTVLFCLFFVVVFLYFHLEMIHVV